MLVLLAGCPSNSPPGTPALPAMLAGSAGVQLECRLTTADPDGDDVAYLIDWGDSTSSEWSELFASGETAAVSHAYAGSGIYQVRARARDTKQAESGWSAYCPVYIDTTDYWQPDRADTLAFDSIVQTNSVLFRLDFEEGRMTAADTVMPGTTRTRLINEVRNVPFKFRFRCDSFEHRYADDSVVFGYSLLAEADSAETTCTITIVETIPGVLRLHAYASTRYLGDTTIIVGPDTIVLPVYDTLFSDTSLYIEKALRGASTDGCVLRKNGGSWVLAEVGGGSWFYAPGPDDAPYIAQLTLNGDHAAHTILLRPDTTQFGIHRLYAPDELPSWPVGDSLYASAVLSTDLDCIDCIHCDGDRYAGTQSDRAPLSRPGTQRLLYERIPVEVLYDADVEYIATIWGISIRVE